MKSESKLLQNDPSWKMTGHGYLWNVKKWPGGSISNEVNFQRYTGVGLKFDPIESRPFGVLIEQAVL